MDICARGFFIGKKRNAWFQACDCISISCTQAVPQFQTRPPHPSKGMCHILMLGGVLVVGGTVLALQPDSLVREEMAGDGVKSCGDSKADDNKERPKLGWD